MVQKVLLVHVNLMNSYQGFTADDNNPLLRVNHNPVDQVHERYNFKVAPDGRVYGAWCESKVRLRRIDPSAGRKLDKLADVLVIFWATVKPNRHAVVGWYSNATVWRVKKVNTALDRDQHEYIAEADDCEILSLEDRRNKKFTIPLSRYDPNKHGVSNHFGQWYAIDEDGSPKNQPWLSNLISAINSHEKDEQTLTRLEETFEERSQGFQSNVKIRKAIEQYAEQRAIAYFEREGYLFIKKVGKPYDLLFEKDGHECFVEVKGTQTNGRKIFLTVNEVNFSREKQPHYMLFVLRNINIPDPSNPQPEGGVKKIYRSLLTERLSPIHYEYTCEL